MKKIKVPDGMLKAALTANVDGVDTSERIARGLEASIRWLSENPIVPTLDQWESCYRGIPSGSYPSSSEVEIAQCVEWQHRMFLAPEPNPVVQKIKDSLLGCTLTVDDAVELMNDIRMCSNIGPKF